VRGLIALPKETNSSPMASYEIAISMSRSFSCMTSLKDEAYASQKTQEEGEAHVQSETWQRSTKTPQKDFEIREGFSRF
jgi:hypothetical protein